MMHAEDRAASHPSLWGWNTFKLTGISYIASAGISKALDDVM